MERDKLWKLKVTLYGLNDESSLSKSGTGPISGSDGKSTVNDPIEICGSQNLATFMERKHVIVCCIMLCKIMLMSATSTINSLALHCCRFPREHRNMVSNA